METMTIPWKGLTSYEEQDAAKFKFAGRTQAIGKYYSLITNNLISTLYGQTGCGKTSLLQAGIFPLLRQEAYFPVMCRLALKKDSETFSDYILARLDEESAKNGISITTSSVGLEHVDQNVKYNLWHYFYGHEFRNKAGHVVFPIIVLDQFEEVLINNRQESILLLEQLNYLVGDDLLLPEDCFANFRVTISLREDFLYLIEDALDYAKLPILRENRMRLSPLTHDEAAEVVALGREIFSEGEYTTICDTIIRMASDRRNQVSTNMLSLICSQIYEMFENDENRLLSVEEIEKMGKDPLRDFYLTCLQHISPETSTFIENHLVINEFRRPVTLKEFNMNVPIEDRKVLTEGKYKILQVITAGDNECIELIHDTVARTIDNINSERKKQKKEQKTFHTRMKVFYESYFWAGVGGLWMMSIALNNQAAINWGIAGYLLLGVNWLFSAAVCGKKNYSVWNLVPLWLFNMLFAFCVFSENAMGKWIVVYGLIVLYLFSMPIANFFLLRTHSENSKLGFWESFKYVFGGAVFHEMEEKRRLSLLAVCILVLMGPNLFIMLSKGVTVAWPSWMLWILLPLAIAWVYPISIVCLAKKTFDSIREHRLEQILVVILILFFVISIHIPGWNFSRIIFYALFGLLAIYSAFFKLDVSTPKRWRCMTFIYAWICGMIPIMFLPFGFYQFLGQGYARCWHQPKVCAQSAHPFYSVYDKNGLSTIIGEDQLLMPVLYQHIDSVCYDSTDVTLYTASGNYSWSEMYADRCPGSYLDKRVSLLEKTDCSGWEETDFNHIAELATAYRIQGQDSLADILTLQYYVRRMLQANMYAVLTPSRYGAEPTCCADIIKINVDRMKNTATKISYYPDFVELANRIPRAMSYAEIVKKSKTTLQDLAYTNYSDLLSLLRSFRTDTIPYQFACEQLSETVDFLYLTRNDWGPYFVDSIFAYAYGLDYDDDYQYQASMSWNNIFLQRYELAQDYAKKSIQLAPENYLTYTNLQTSLFLSGQTDCALELVRLYKDSVVYQKEGNDKQCLTPTQAVSYKITEGDILVQDIHYLVKIGVLRDTTTASFRTLRHELESAFSLHNDRNETRRLHTTTD